MKNFPVSIASYSFNNMLALGTIDVFGYLESLKYRYNVNNADIWSDYLKNNFDPDFLKKIRKAMDDEGITLANLCVDGPVLWADDEHIRAKNKEKMLKYIKAADILGAKTIRIDFGGDENTEMSDEAFEYIVNTYREYCGICYELGMKIGPENHWGWDRIPANLKKVKDAVDHPAYGHLFHFGNFKNDHEAGTELCISYAMHTHVSAGVIPWAKDIIRRLALSGYEGCYSVEHHTGEHERSRVAWQLASLNNIIEEIKSEPLDETSKTDYVSREIYIR